MRIALHGSTGRMGLAIKQLVAESSEYLIEAEFHHSAKLENPQQLENCDVVIDFSTPEGLSHALQIALASSTPLLTGTTGWDAERERIYDSVEEAGGSFLYGANFSLGVLLFERIAVQAAMLYGQLPQYDFGLHESHHAAKADNPSGTALRLAEAILPQLPAKQRIIAGNPKSVIPTNALQVSSSRFGKVPGTHTLFIDGPDDAISFQHAARGRTAFARGAISAAQWLVGKPGFFSVQDYLDATLQNTSTSHKD